MTNREFQITDISMRDDQKLNIRLSRIWTKEEKKEVQKRIKASKSTFSFPSVLNFGGDEVDDYMPTESFTVRATSKEVAEKSLSVGMIVVMNIPVTIEDIEKKDSEFKE